ncbi:MAG: hypothetical protein GY768_12755 [Planctomycetaceae bacterium]|nr:hypothetical protein [Planctomycetaceae bacterium]
MPATLTGKNICGTRVPPQWAPIIQELKKFIQLEMDVSRGKPDRPTDADRARLRELHDHLVATSDELLEPSVLDGQTSTDDVEIFARAVCVLMKLDESVGSHQSDILDTAGSDTLRDFEPDFRATPACQSQLLQALKSFPELSDETLRGVQKLVDADAEDAKRKKMIVRAIRDEFGLWPTANNLRENIFRFFSTCYPDTGLAIDEVELIATGCMIFFCLPFSQTELYTQRYQQADADQQEPVRQFLKRVTKFSQWQFAHFPVFGFLRGEALPDSLLEKLANTTGLSVASVAYEISRLTAIVPLHEVDKYVVHDVWGHGWQASLLRFDDLYVQLARYADRLKLDDQAPSHTGETIRFADCFRGRGDQLQLDPQQFHDFVEGKIVERLPVAMTPVLAEVIADLAEFKYTELHPDKAENLLSSSLLKTLPSKLDLIMQDVPYYFKQATKIFRLWANRADRHQRTIEQLVSVGATPEAAKREVSRAVAIWRELEATTFAAVIRGEVVGQELEVNVMTRLALNFLGIHRAKIHAYQWIRDKEVGSLPLKSFRDLLLISAAVYFETDPAQNLWRVDEFVTFRIEPLCERLAIGLTD